MGTLYETESWLQVLFVTGILGGGAAWLTGRACAHTWRPLVQVIAYSILLGAVVRFFHFALFEADLFSLASFLSRYAVFDGDRLSVVAHHPHDAHGDPISVAL